MPQRISQETASSPDFLRDVATSTALHPPPRQRLRTPCSQTSRLSHRDFFFCHGPHLAAIHVPVESSKGSAWAIEGQRTLCTGRVGVGGSWPCRAARCGQSLYLLRGGGGKFRASQADSKSAAPGCIVADKVGVEEFGRHTCWQQPRARCRQLGAVAQTHNLLLMAPATA